MTGIMLRDWTFQKDVCSSQTRIHLRHHDIEDDQVRLIAQSGIKAFLPICWLREYDDRFFLISRRGVPPHPRSSSTTRSLAINDGTERRLERRSLNGAGKAANGLSPMHSCLFQTLFVGREFFLPMLRAFGIGPSGFLEFPNSGCASWTIPLAHAQSVHGPPSPLLAQARMAELMRHRRQMRFSASSASTSMRARKINCGRTRCKLSASSRQN